MISIIIPTFNEAENVKIIVPKLTQMLKDSDISGEILIVDDNSPDGTADAALELAERYPVKVHVRYAEKGLSKAVIDGFERAEGDICVVMDADLSHPVEQVPAMITPILSGLCDVTVGSRYVEGGGFDRFPLHRKWISKGAGLLAKGVTRISDPTSGFMAVRKKILEGVRLDPLGWKIVLEVVVKTNPRIVEVPIVFTDRKEGQSKLDFRAQIDYFHHLWRLYNHRYPSQFEFIKFCLVGLSGFFVDTAVLVCLVHFYLFDPRLAAVFAFLIAVCWNYVLDRVWTFNSGRKTRISYSYPSFVMICLAGLGIRIGVMHLLIAYTGMGKSPWYVLASVIGIFVATFFNFLGSKYIAFSTRFHKS